jgi:hypothetical protein
MPQKSPPIAAQFYSTAQLKESSYLSGVPAVLRKITIRFLRSVAAKFCCSRVATFKYTSLDLI